MAILSDGEKERERKRRRKMEFRNFFRICGEDLRKIGSIYDCLMTSLRFLENVTGNCDERRNGIERRRDDLTNDDTTDHALMIEDERELSTANVVRLLFWQADAFKRLYVRCELVQRI